MEVIVARRIASAGGSSQYDMGSHFDVACFYHAGRQLVQTDDGRRVIDRVFKRYLHERDYAVGTEVFTQLRDFLKTSCLLSLDWHDLDAGTTEENIGLLAKQRETHETDVLKMYRTFCTSVLNAIESAAWKAANDRWPDEIFHQTYVKTIRSSTSHSMTDIRRPAAVLDALGADDPPFWLYDRNYAHDSTSREERMAVALFGPNVGA
jgi:hypothetical protein